MLSSRLILHPSNGSQLELAGSPGFCSKAIRNCQLPTKKEGGVGEREGTLPRLARRAWRGSMSFSLSSHKTDFERPHCLTLPVFVRRPLCRERRRRRTQKVRLRDVQSKWNGPRRGGEGRERERAELTPCGGRVIKSSVSCRRWKSPPTTTTTAPPPTGPTEQQSRDKD